MKDDITAGEIWAGIALATAILFIAGLCSTARGQEGHLGEGHDVWHEEFYNALQSPGGFSCCHLADCRPTSGRTVDDHYEVKINGEWVRVLPDKIVKATAPDADYHVCAPPVFDGNPEHVYCVVLPPEV